MVHQLKTVIETISQENDHLKRCTGVTLGKRHKQTCTAHPGEDLATEGYVLYPSPKVVAELKQHRDTQFTQKYVDPKGEARLIPIVKLPTNMYTAIRRCLSK